MKLLVLFSVLSALVAMAAALSPYRYAIYPNSTACGTLRQRTCKGNLICSSFIYSGPCCGGCSGGSCGVCSAGYACIGGNCTSSYPIIIGCVIGGLVLIGIISAIVRSVYSNRSTSYSTGTTAIVVTESAPVAQPVYTEEMVVIAPPPQQAYVPDTYVSTGPQVTTTYTQNTYGAPVGGAYYTTTGGVHETY